MALYFFYLNRNKKLMDVPPVCLHGNVCTLPEMFYRKALIISFHGDKQEMSPDEVTGQVCGEATPLTKNTFFKVFLSNKKLEINALEMFIPMKQAVSRPFQS
ncbi:hypothetical protein NQD34_007956 [Periophthalmus magnuspinnatus]|nr:hypothetical protein NQD34_007956 [Periophthalmus magnuspinnatus]